MPLPFNLPEKIETLQQAKDYLTLLCKMGYDYHPDDNVLPEFFTWNMPKKNQPLIRECKQMNELMAQIFKDTICGPKFELFDPYEWGMAFSIDPDDDNTAEMRDNNQYFNEVQAIKANWKIQSAQIIDDGETVICTCGNKTHPMGEDFYPCDISGNDLSEREELIGIDNKYYCCCLNCGNIIDISNHGIIIGNVRK